MDGDFEVWYGPRVLTKVRQVCIPVQLLRALNVEEGSELMFALTEDRQEIRIRPTGRSRASAAETQNL